MICKSRNPWCFRHKKRDLPVEYFSKPKARPTGDILGKVLITVNKHLSGIVRSVLIFMDTAGCHLLGKVSLHGQCWLPSTR